MARRPDKGSNSGGSNSGPPRWRDGSDRDRSDRSGRTFAGKSARRPDTSPPARRDVSDERGSTARPDDKLVRIAGVPSVTELFATGAERVERLYFDAATKAQASEWCAMLARRRKVFRQVGDDEIRRVAGTAMHGGIVALARPRPIREFDPDGAAAWAASGQSLLILDGVGNPQNIGAIARTAAFFGVRRIVVSDHPGQAGLSDASYRVAKGGLERIEIYRAHGLPDVLRRLAASYQIVGTAVERGTYLKKLERTGKPVALVLGNEEDGLPPATLAACTSIVMLDGSGHVQSLNVSAAAAILIHSLLA